MDEEIERLRTMLGNQDVWQENESEIVARTEFPPESDDLYSDPDDDEKILSYDHRIGGRLEDAVSYGQVGELIHFPEYSLQIGQEAHEEETFCTLQALTRYPYNYISAASRGRVVREFFAQGKLYERVWDFCKAILLVPARQVHNFLVTINIAVETFLKLPDSAADTGLIVNFPKDGTPRPRYLGHTDEREMAEWLKQSVPSSSFRPETKPEACDPTEQSLLAFKKKIERLLESEKKKKTITKQKKKTKRIARQKAWNNSIKRVQRYLGIRDLRHYHNDLSGRVGMSWDDPTLSRLSERADEVATAVSTTTDLLDVNKTAPFKQEDSVVFISVDVESFERDHNLITEIGIASLDTADIVAESPGELGSNWMKAIHARHFRIKEHDHLINRDFLVGCPEHFQFGLVYFTEAVLKRLSESERISIKTAPQEISKCFKAPYSKEKTPAVSEEIFAANEIEHNNKRNIVLVGHDIETDIKYLRKLGYNPYNLSNLQELIDTSSMYRALERESSPRNLGSILANLDLTGWYLHNAGNDAVYTLQAMISIAIKALLEKPDEEYREQTKNARIAQSVKIATDAAWEADQGWSSDGGDGGEPVNPIPTTSSNAGEEKEVPRIESPWRNATDSSNKVDTGGVQNMCPERVTKSPEW